MKLMFKKKIFKMKTTPSNLKSYHLLTLFYWFMEGNLEEIWDDDSFEAFENNLKNLLLFVADQVYEEKIPHYFIRTLNLANLIKSPSRQLAIVNLTDPPKENDEEIKPSMQEVSLSIMKMVKEKTFSR